MFLNKISERINNAIDSFFYNVFTADKIKFKDYIKKIFDEPMVCCKDIDINLSFNLYNQEYVFFNRLNQVEVSSLNNKREKSEEIVYDYINNIYDANIQYMYYDDGHVEKKYEVSVDAVNKKTNELKLELPKMLFVIKEYNKQKIEFENALTIVPDFPSFFKKDNFDYVMKVLKDNLIISDTNRFLSKTKCLNYAVIIKLIDKNIINVLDTNFKNKFIPSYKKFFGIDSKVYNPFMRQKGEYNKRNKTDFNISKPLLRYYEKDLSFIDNM